MRLIKEGDRRPLSHTDPEWLKIDNLLTDDGPPSSVKSRRRRKKKSGKQKAIARSKSFYGSDEWRQVRYGVLTKAKGKCQLCGVRGGKKGVVLHVDHIKPRSKFPRLALNPDNLQVLCEDCNLGKGNRDSIDWRQ